MPDDGTGTPSGSTGTQDPPAPTTPPPPQPDPAASATTTFTQDQVNAIATREADKAKRAAAKALAEKLGFPTVEEAEAFIAAAKEAEKAQMTEAERKLAEAIEKETAAAAREASAAKTIHDLTVKEALIEAGVPVKDAGLVAAMVSVETGAPKEDVAAAVVSLKERMPLLFGQPPAPPTAPSSEPASGGNPAQRSESMSALDRGRKLAQERQGRTST